MQRRCKLTSPLVKWTPDGLQNTDWRPGQYGFWHASSMISVLEYRIFSEFPELNDQSITLFLQTAQALHSVPMGDRGNAFGIFQADVGMWQ